MDIEHVERIARALFEEITERRMRGAKRWCDQPQRTRNFYIDVVQSLVNSGAIATPPDYSYRRW